MIQFQMNVFPSFLFVTHATPHPLWGVGYPDNGKKTVVPQGEKPVRDIVMETRQSPVNMNKFWFGDVKFPHCVDGE